MTDEDKEIFETRTMNEVACLKDCFEYSEDPVFRKEIAAVSHAERVVFLLDNGIGFALMSKKDSKDLEKFYREEAHMQKHRRELLQLVINEYI